ncbi:MAG: NUDIX hydrolase, partial [Candidatus Saccharimonas sp.]
SEFIYRGPVDDPRSTLHAWPETTAYLWRLDEKCTVIASDDARNATWMPLDRMPDKLYGSHAILAKCAFTRLPIADGL